MLQINISSVQSQIKLNFINYKIFSLFLLYFLLDCCVFSQEMQLLLGHILLVLPLFRKEQVPWQTQVHVKHQALFQVQVGVLQLSLLRFELGKLLKFKCQVKSKNKTPVCVCVSHSVVSDSLQPHGLQPTRVLSPWDSPGKNAGVDSHSLLQGIFPSQGSNPGCRQILDHLSCQGSP